MKTPCFSLLIHQISLIFFSTSNWGQLLEIVKREGLSLTAVLTTHHHWWEEALPWKSTTFKINKANQQLNLFSNHEGTMLVGTRLCWRRSLDWESLGGMIGSGVWQIRSPMLRNSRCSQCVTNKNDLLHLPGVFLMPYFLLSSLIPSMWGVSSLPATPLVTCATLFGRMTALMPLLCLQVFIYKYQELVNQL